MDSFTIASRDPAGRKTPEQKTEEEVEEEGGGPRTYKGEKEEKNLAVGGPFTEDTKSQCQLKFEDRKQK